MSREFPDRVTAIVDLMSQMFLLAVMLFVMAIPMRSQMDSAEKERFWFSVKFENEGGAPIAAVLPDMDTERAEIVFELRLDDGTELRTLDKSLKAVRAKFDEDGIRVEGYLAKNYEPKTAVILLRDVRKNELIGQRVTIVTAIEGRCDEAEKVLTHDNTDPAV